MSRTVKITCDGIGCNQVSPYGSTTDWVLIKFNPSFVMAIYPTPDDTMYFHDMECLKRWVNYDRNR